MRGIILSGGKGTRLRPLTNITSKQLLPVYNRPMIYYPLNTLLKAGIKEILIIVAPERAGDYSNLLGSGKEFGAKFTYEIQDEPRGLAEALIIGENFIDDKNVVMILGDNIFEDYFAADIQSFKSGAKIFAKQVPDPERFGVAFFKNGKVTEIIEKPKKPKSSYAVIGVYMYDAKVFHFIKTLKPSRRGELEITDVNNAYIRKKQLEFDLLQGWWTDSGTFDSLLRANQLVADKRRNEK